MTDVPDIPDYQNSLYIFHHFCSAPVCKILLQIPVIPSQFPRKPFCKFHAMHFSGKIPYYKNWIYNHFLFFFGKHLFHFHDNNKREFEVPFDKSGIYTSFHCIPLSHASSPSHNSLFQNFRKFLSSAPDHAR